MKYKYKRNKDGYFRASWVVGKLPDGKQDRVTVRDRDYNTFLSKLDEAQRLYKKGVVSEDTTVADWCERWFSVYKAKTSEELKEHFRRKLDLDIIPAIGSMRIRDVRASHLMELLNNSGKKKGTVIKIRIAIKQVFSAALEDGLIERDPSLKLPLPENLEETPRRPLTDFERKIVWDVAREHKHGAFILAMLLCGLRRGECAGLTAERVDFENKKVIVIKAIRYLSNAGIVKNPKSEAGVREMPLPDKLYPFLMKQCKGKQPQDYIFTRVGGEMASDITIRRWWRSFMRQCHIKAGAELYRNKILVKTSPFDDKISAHYLRHTYATDIHAAGVHEREQKYFMGHKSYDVTDGYRAISDESFKRAADSINTYFEKLYL